MAKKSQLVMHPDATATERANVRRYDVWNNTAKYMVPLNPAIAAVMVSAWFVRGTHWQIVFYMCGSVLLVLLCLFMACIGWPWLIRQLMLNQGRAFWLHQRFWDRYKDQTARINDFESIAARDRQRLALYVALKGMSPRTRRVVRVEESTRPLLHTITLSVIVLP